MANFLIKDDDKRSGLEQNRRGTKRTYLESSDETDMPKVNNIIDNKKNEQTPGQETKSLCSNSVADDSLHTIESLDEKEKPKRRKNRSSIVPTMGQPAPILELDLSCNEFQTARDIQYIEENATGDYFEEKPKIKAAVRRSLRGQLLESRLSVHERLAVVKQHMANCTPSSAMVIENKDFSNSCSEKDSFDPTKGLGLTEKDCHQGEKWNLCCMLLGFILTLVLQVQFWTKRAIKIVHLLFLVQFALNG